ncbi:MAG TPA: radical SAM protein, partial [Thermodesulfobacteriota bacterium]|nr:radical SAM protein [Thermodesulfobacteriota bacterium]
MKIFLIQPPIQDFYQTAIRTQPIGLAYLAASLQAQGHEVEIFDCQTEKKKMIPIPPELSYLRSFYPFNDRSPFKLYSGYYHFGRGWGELKEKIKNSQAEVFGVSSSFTPYLREALEVARIIKEWDKRKIVVLGGSHVSSDPEGMLKNSLVDYLILGEGEIRFPWLLDQIEKKRRKKMGNYEGIGFHGDEEVRINPVKSFIENLDFLPYPARELLDLDCYRIKKKRSTMIITSRGCPHGCAYCSAHLVMGTAFRRRSPENIIHEMIECREKFDIQAFDIEDDNFTFDLKRAKRLLSLIIEIFGEGSLELSAMNGISFASLDGELLGLMKRAGFKTINLSFVSTDTLTRERMKRPRGLIDFDSIVHETEKIGLQVIAYAILGMPGQTLEEMVETIIYLMGKRVLIGPSIYYPTPGTPLFEVCKKENLLPPHPLQWRSSAFPIETGDFTRLDLATLFRFVRVINFIKGKMAEKEIDDGMTWREVSRFIEGRGK